MNEYLLIAPCLVGLGIHLSGRPLPGFLVTAITISIGILLQMSKLCFAHL